MRTECCPQLELDLLPSKPVVARFDGGHITSDAGLTLLAALDRKRGLTQRLAACLADPRDPKRTRVSFLEMLRQRVFGIAAGYEDCNDHDELRFDGLLKLTVGRAPLSGRPLASQPTLSRFENHPTEGELALLARAIVADFVDGRRARPPEEIVLDFDATDDPTHGQQELNFYHGHYECHCYLPLLVFATCDGAPQEPIAAVLRPGNSGAARGVPEVLERLVEQIRDAFPRTRLLFRGDSGMGGPDVYERVESLGVRYVIGLARNSRLERLAAPLVARARAEFAATGAKVRIFDEFLYRAESWTRARRVIVKAEVMPSHPKETNVRFVVTDLEEPTPEALYERYIERGDVECRIKELKLDCVSGRTSCHRFLANQFRLLLHLAAYRLLVLLRTGLTNPDLRRAQVETLRRRLLKVGALVTESVRRVVLHLAEAYPWKDDWIDAAEVVRTGGIA
jgi:hypothetical protein